MNYSHSGGTDSPCLSGRSEFYGRRLLWVISHIAMVAFLGGSAGSHNIATLIVLRFLTGTFGGSPIVNSGGVLADIFAPTDRGLALTLYAVAPFLGPILGPIIGGFVSENAGWRWVQGVCCIAIGIIGGSPERPSPFSPASANLEYKASSASSLSRRHMDRPFS